MKMESQVDEDGDFEQPARKKVKSSQEINAVLISLQKPISPPRRQGSGSITPNLISSPKLTSGGSSGLRISSPFQLTTIRDLSSLLNDDAVTLKDILGDPLIAECWEFNYLHDIDFLMEAFDPDTKDLVKVHIVHGFWKDEDSAGLKMQAARYPNVTLRTAFMPEMFGTHHTKMMVLLRHDDQAQIIIHTANMIKRDWTNMTQALWRSPLLPFLPSSNLENSASPSPVLGSGARFKTDFLNYLRAYDTKRSICKPLVAQLVKYDFSAIRGTLIASVPGRHSVETDRKTLWGWSALRQALKAVPSHPITGPKEREPEIVLQVSSIATLGQNDQWLQKTLFRSLSESSSPTQTTANFGVIFPTADEIRRSLDGYQSGHSIHTKIQSAAQKKQLQYLKPLLYHWAGDGSQHTVAHDVVQDAGRKRAAPHIKTYIRFADAAKTEIDWALLTSANISKQAWGDAVTPAGDVRISSYELGVLVWPELYAKDATMVPTFKRDMPSFGANSSNDRAVVGLRLPYDLPLVKYARDDEPWCATKSYVELDWMGRSWP